MTTVEEILTDQVDRLWKIVEDQQNTIAILAGKISVSTSDPDEDDEPSTPMPL